MSAQNQHGAPELKSQYSSIARVSHIPLIESTITSIHETLSKTPLIRIPYTISLALSSTIVPYVQAASNHFPFAPFLAIGDRAANKTLDIAQEKWPYPFEKKPEQVWGDVRHVADSRVIKPAVSVARSVDQSLSPYVDSFTSVLHKVHDLSVFFVAKEEGQVQAINDLLRRLKDDVADFASEEQKASLEYIYSALSNLFEQSSDLLSALRSRSEDAATRTQNVGNAVLAELGKLSPALSSISSDAGKRVQEAIRDLDAVLTSKEPLTDKASHVRSILYGTLVTVVRDITAKVQGLVEGVRSSVSSGSVTSLSSSSNGLLLKTSRK